MNNGPTVHILPLSSLPSLFNGPGICVIRNMFLDCLWGLKVVTNIYMFLWSLQQVDLHTLKVVTGIATQGAISKETQKAYYVTTFKLEVSTNGEDWMVYRHGKNHKVGWKWCTDAPPKNNLDADRRHTFRENTQDGIYRPHELTTDHKPSCWLQLQSFHHPSLGFN